MVDTQDRLEITAGLRAPRPRRTPILQGERGWAVGNGDTHGGLRGLRSLWRLRCSWAPALTSAGCDSAGRQPPRAGSSALNDRLTDPLWRGVAPIYGALLSPLFLPGLARGSLPHGT